MVLVAPGAISPFHSICDALTVHDPPPTDEQEPVIAVNCTGNTATNSAPALSRCTPSPLLVSLTSIVRTLPPPIQASVPLPRTEMSVGENLAPGGAVMLIVDVLELFVPVGSVVVAPTVAVLLNGPTG